MARRTDKFRAATKSLRLAAPVALAMMLPPTSGAKAASLAGANIEPGDRLAPLLAMDRAVATVNYRLSTANLELCPRHGPQTGIVLHSLTQYGPRLRAVAATTLNLDDRPTIETIVPGSPAESAGLRAGDVLLTINGTAASDVASRVSISPSTVSDDQVRQALERLQSALGSGPTVVRVLRLNQAVDVTLTPVIGCQVQAKVFTSPRLAASANNTEIFISTRLAEYTANPGELAMVLGHEFAHTILRTRRVAVGMPAERPGGLITVRDEERNADEVGLYLAARAGYDINEAPEFWRRLGSDDPLDSILQFSHPSDLARARDLERVRNEILRLQAQQEPLIPLQLKSPPR